MIAETMECDFRGKKSNTPLYKLKSSNDKENGIDELHSKKVRYLVMAICQSLQIKRYILLSFEVGTERCFTEQDYRKTHPR